MVTKLPQKPLMHYRARATNFFVLLVELSHTLQVGEQLSLFLFSWIFALLEDERYYTVHSVHMLWNDIRCVYNNY